MPNFFKDLARTALTSVAVILLLFGVGVFAREIAPQYVDPVIEGASQSVRQIASLYGELAQSIGEFTEPISESEPAPTAPDEVLALPAPPVVTALKAINDLTILSSLDGVFNNRGNIDLVAGANLTITPDDLTNSITLSLFAGTGSDLNADFLDSLDSSQFLRSDVSDNYTSGTLAFNLGTTLRINGSFSCLNCLGASQISDLYLLNSGDIASGDYAFDTNTLFINSVNNRVGIGTTSPSFRLETRGSGDEKISVVATRPVTKPQSVCKIQAT